MFKFLKQLWRSKKGSDSSLEEWEQTYADDLAYLSALDRKIENRPVQLQEKKTA